MKTSDFDYELPSELIAQTPAEPRSASKMLVYHKKSGAVDLCRFLDILKYLRPSDVIVINTTKVMRARLFGQKLGTGTRVEILLHKELAKNEFEVLLRPGKKLKAGDKIQIENAIGTILSKNTLTGTATINFDRDVSALGEMPLPSYIRTPASDESRYQTVYADKTGSAAAPTAGLHWTPELMHEAEKLGVTFCKITLHVGLGTFRPVKTDLIADHIMHSEYYEIPPKAAQILAAAKADKRRIICTGTTSVRTLESVCARFGEIRACTGDTEIFIYPPYKFRACNALITNFHLPKSTLFMLISAFIGREKALELYALAIREKFRFYSFGDACLFLDD